MSTASITASTNGSDVSAASALTASVGRLKVGMPTVTRLVSGPVAAATAEYQPAETISVSVSVVTSNQIHPPSSNGPRSSSNSMTP